jgi:hypothetical protein
MAERPTPIVEFCARVEAYLAHTGMAPARFGLLACRDQSFVFDLREGKREPRLSTIDKVDEFMTAHPNGECAGKGETTEAMKAAC